MNKPLIRKTFTTSRLLEFFAEKELTMQIGHSKEWWPIALLKELIDNSLDAAETIGKPPEVQIVIDNDYFSVEDNGPGIPDKVIKRSLDYSMRVSDKSYYVSPTRGQLGNALKCVYAAPFVSNGETSRVEISNGNATHQIEIVLDRIAQKPEVKISKVDKANCKKVTIFYPDSARLLLPTKTPDFYKTLPMDAETLVKRYTMFNPHTKFILNGKVYEPSNISWKKWLPNEPTSPHWYTPEQLRALISAYLSIDRDSEKTIREFVSEFRGLSGSAKQKKVTEDAGLAGKRLRDLIVNNNIPLAPVEKLLLSLKQNSKQVKAAFLGLIGEEHIKTRMIDDYHIAPESFKYRKKVKIDDETNLPQVVEIGFAIYAKEHEQDTRQVISGLNWSPTFSVLSEVRGILMENYIESQDSICLVYHVARPKFEYTDKGKEHTCL
ncbi:MAG: ATP-binding protein [Candidatus Beckwithbacteria bacterium]